jgi:hypothetical protein
MWVEQVHGVGWMVVGLLIVAFAIWALIPENHK